MRVRYQKGYLRVGHRKRGPDGWEFLWWDREPTGIRIRRKAVIGTIQQYPNVEDAWQASNGLRVSINETRNRQPEQAITVANLVDHYSVSVQGVAGDKDLELTGGDLTIQVRSPEDYSHVDLSVRFGDVSGTQIANPMGWIGNSVRKEGNGKYRLHAHVMAGDLVLRS